MVARQTKPISKQRAYIQHFLWTPVSSTRVKIAAFPKCLHVHYSHLRLCGYPGWYTVFPGCLSGWLQFLWVPTVFSGWLSGWLQLYCVPIWVVIVFSWCLSGWLQFFSLMPIWVVTVFPRCLSGWLQFFPVWLSGVGCRFSCVTNRGVVQLFLCGYPGWYTFFPVREICILFPRTWMSLPTLVRMRTNRGTGHQREMTSHGVSNVPRTNGMTLHISQVRNALMLENTILNGNCLSSARPHADVNCEFRVCVGWQNWMQAGEGGGGAIHGTTQRLSE